MFRSEPSSNYELPNSLRADAGDGRHGFSRSYDSWAEIFSTSEEQAEISSFGMIWGVHAALQSQIGSDSTKRQRWRGDRYSRVRSKEDSRVPAAFMWIILSVTRSSVYFAMPGENGCGICDAEGLRIKISACEQL